MTRFIIRLNILSSIKSLAKRIGYIVYIVLTLRPSLELLI